MNNPENLAIDIEEQREWLNTYKSENGLPWSTLATQIGVPQGTISAFGGGTYAGNTKRIADAVYRFRQLLAKRTEIEVAAPPLPNYYETPTSRRMTAILNYAQARGRIAVIATSPGLGKTETLTNYAHSSSNVWVATMSPATSTMNNMQIAVLETLGETDVKGNPQAMSKRIKKHVAGSGGLIAIDEAQYLDHKAQEEIRSWNDDPKCSIGVCLLGNEDVLRRLELGSRKDDFARLASRVAQRLIAVVPEAGDVLALADAWGVEDRDMREFLLSLRSQPGALRTLTMMMETASMLAAADRIPLSLAHMQEGWALQSQRGLAA